ncbi:NACHT domain-containing protein [Sorangium sp. So ce388]|uniref:NACHT domain-containing protein n=1 Tax=Sorangium sp. So ce388 TaxID=3133309 RepID=UPI003F5B0BED
MSSKRPTNDGKASVRPCDAQQDAASQGDLTEEHPHDTSGGASQLNINIISNSTIGSFASGHNTSVVGSVRTPSLSGQIHQRSDSKLRRRILQEVKQYVHGMRAGSLYSMVRLDLGLVNSPGDIELPLFRRGRADSEVHPIAPGTRIIQLLSRANDSLLILGEPGSGKTTILFELCQDLVERAISHEDSPIPIYLNLSSWSKERKPLSYWAIDEAWEVYGITKPLAKRWLESGQLALLLDGLDEVSAQFREDCIGEINEYRKNVESPVIVCSRTHDYRPLSVALRCHEAVVVQPLDIIHVIQTLSTKADLAILVRAIDAVPSVKAMVQLPIFLNVIAITCISSSVWSSDKDFDGLTEDSVLGIYVQHMIADDSRRGPHRFFLLDSSGRSRFVRWLSILAKIMLRDGQSSISAEQMQPDWLPTMLLRSLFHVLVLAIVVLFIGVPVYALSTVVFGWLGLPGGKVVGLGLGLTGSLIVWLASNKFFGVGGGAAIGAVFGISIAAAAVVMLNWSTGAVVVGVVVGFLVGYTYGVMGNHALREYGEHADAVRFKIRMADRMQWSWTDARSAALKVMPAAAMAGLIFLGISIPSAGLRNGLAIGITVFLVGVCALGLARGHRRYEEVEERRTPNQGLWRSGKNALLISFYSGAIMALLVSVMGIVVVRDPVDVLMGFVVAYIAGAMPGGLYVGGLACVQHFVLRLVLWMVDYGPVRYSDFMNCAVDCVLMRRVGARYYFVHRMVLEHLARQPI